MRVFMLGWEFPPFISGGLGTACYGLTKALSKQSTDVVFVLPKAVDTEYSSHVKLLSPQAPKAAMGDRSAESVASTYQLDDEYGGTGFEHVTFKAVPSRMISPYQSAGGKLHEGGGAAADPMNQPISVMGGGGGGGMQGGPAIGHYEGDLMREARRYARLCVDLARGEAFDVIHAHDWLTYPAGLAVAAATGKPLVVHVHLSESRRLNKHHVVSFHGRASMFHHLERAAFGLALPANSRPAASCLGFHASGGRPWLAPDAQPLRDLAQEIQQTQLQLRRADTEARFQLLLQLGEPREHLREVRVLQIA